MEKISLRIYVLLCTLVMWLRAIAQIDEDELGGRGRGRSRGGDEGMGDMQGMIDYQPIRFSTQDVITVILLLIACYVFGKIWKGCSYLILVLAAIFYYMTR